MSGTVPPGHDPAKPGTDPSMDDILASIRRILSEDEAAGPAAPAGTEPPAPAKAPDDGVLMLDSSMIVAADESGTAAPAAAEPPVPESHVPPHAPESPAMSATETTAAAPPPGRETALLAPESAAAAASSVDALMRTLSTERGTRVNRNGPTIEDLVREEIRPVLKAWLDAHLPPLVERLVRAEIERVSGRTAL